MSKIGRLPTKSVDLTGMYKTAHANTSMLIHISTDRPTQVLTFVIDRGNSSQRVWPLISGERISMLRVLSSSAG